MRLKVGFLGKFSLSVLFLVAFLTSCRMEPAPTMYNVTIQAPVQASLIVTGNSIGTQTILSNSQRVFSVVTGETLQLAVSYNSSENNYSVYQWNGATEIDELKASTVITSDTVISVVFKEQFTISFTAPEDSALSISKGPSIIKTVEAGATDTITDWIGTELSFSLNSLEANHEVVISSGDAEKSDRLSGSLVIASDDSVILSTSIMPYVTLISPDSYSMTYQVDNQESSLLPQGDTISVYITSGSTLEVTIQDIDVEHFEVTDWSGLTPNTYTSGTTIINSNLTLGLVVSQIQRTLSITEPIEGAYVKIFASSDLSGSSLTGTFKNGITSYSIGSGKIVYLSAQSITGSNFVSWGSTVDDSNVASLPLTMNSNYSFAPAYLSTMVEPGIAYVSPTGCIASEANGSKGLPYLYIQDAIDNMSDGEVRIAAGTYEIDSPIIMKPGVSLVGSYIVQNKGSSWTAPEFRSTDRGVGSSPTTMIELKIIGSGTSSDYLAVGKFSGVEFTNSTVINGISFGYDSLSRSYVAGLLFENGASPIIEHCRIISGAAGQSSQGIRNLASSPKIKFSNIKAGEASSPIGIYNTGAIEILSCEVDTSSGKNNTIGMQNYQATGVIIDNSSISSQGLTSSGFYGYSYGVYNNKSTTTINSSEITAMKGGPTSSFGVTYGTRALYETASASIITGNSIKTLDSAFGGSGVAYYAETSPSVLFNNNISITSGSSKAMGLYLSSSNVIIAGNIIDVGRVNHGGPIYGIYASSSNPLILNNTIEGGDSGNTDESSYGIYLTGSSSVITNNIIFSKASKGPRYGVFGTTSHKLKSINHNAFFDLTTAWYAPQGATSVYYVTVESEFTSSRTGLDESKTIGNIGEPIGINDPLWTTTNVFNGYNSGDFSLHSNANNSLKSEGVALSSSLIQTYIDELNSTYSLTSTEIVNLITTDSALNQRDADNWSIGALQY